MEVLFTIVRAAILAALVLTVWWIIGGSKKQRGFTAIIGAIMRRTFAVVGIVTLTGVIGGGVIFGGIYALPKIFDLVDRKQESKKIERRSPIQLVAEKAVAAEPQPEERPPVAVQEPYPIPTLNKQKMPNTPKFEVMAKDGMSIVFFRKDGSKTGSIIRVIDNDVKTILAIPIEEDSYAMIFPVRYETDCQYQTKESGGKFVPCKKHGPDKFGTEDWGVRYAYFDSL
jgi:hypothetical protein